MHRIDILLVNSSRCLFQISRQKALVFSANLATFFLRLQIRADSSSPDEITPTSSVQLYVDPPQLRFPFKQNKSFSCPLRLINRTDDYVAAKLLTNNPKRYVAATLLCGVVPPRSTYTLVVTMKGHEQLLADEVLSLESCIVHKGVNVENADLHSVGITLFKNIFKEAKGLGADNVHEHKLKVVFDLPKEATFDQVSPACYVNT